MHYDDEPIALDLGSRAGCIAASTTEAGRFLGRAFGNGNGDEANLIVLDGSPIEDIRNTQRIAMVIHHGTIVDRESLLAGTSSRGQ